MSTVTICIASIGRTSLLQTLGTIEDSIAPGAHADIIIADDSGLGAVARLLAGRDAKLPVTVLTAGGRNIAAARNLCMDAAGGEYLAFIDDDEMADPRWLHNLLTLAIETRADAVFGPVNAIFPDSTPAWMKRAGPFVKRPGSRGQRVQTGSTCNALVRTAAVRERGLRFREEFGRTGGEDTDFFFRLEAAGGVLVASDDAFLTELVPEERLALSSLRRRYTRGGQTYARIMLESRRANNAFLFYVSAICGLLVSMMIVALTFFTKKEVAMRYAFKVWLDLGKLRQLFGMPLFELY